MIWKLSSVMHIIQASHYYSRADVRAGARGNLPASNVSKVNIHVIKILVMLRIPYPPGVYTPQLALVLPLTYCYEHRPR
jgi:hypothetical protein